MASLFRKNGRNAEADVYFYSQTCPDCHGSRLNQISRNVTVENRTIPELVNHSLEEMLQWVEQAEATLDKGSYLSAETFFKDLQTTLTRIIKTDLGYLTLDRQTITLSGRCND